MRLAPLLLAVALVGAACGSGGDDQTVAGGTPQAPNDAAPIDSATGGEPEGPGLTPGPDDGAATVPASLDFAAPALGGGTFEGASLAGNDVILWFWAPW